MRWLLSMIKAMSRFPRRCSTRVRARIRRCGWWRPKSCKFLSRKSASPPSTPARLVRRHRHRRQSRHAYFRQRDPLGGGARQRSIDRRCEQGTGLCQGRAATQWRRRRMRRVGARVSYGDIARMAEAPIQGHGFYKNFESGPEAALCVQVAEVEVDPETGQVELKQFTSAHSTGTVLNPLMHQAQIDGGVVMGMGYALMEEVMIDGGKVVTSNFGDGKIPSIRDIPKLKTVIQEFPVGNGPYGGMSIGEPPVVPTAAAIANAVHDAVGVRIYDLPITAEKVLKGLRAKR